jgi:ADP-ribose pyrophosphatase YjhB (NUDIX family)
MITCHLENGDEVGLRHVVVAAIIVRQGKVLLEKRGTFNGKPMLESGKWALVGGFFDRDETLIDAVSRESIEEVGVELKNHILFAIVDNPYRLRDGQRQNVSVVYVCEAGKSTPVESEEVAETKWFDLDNLPSKEEMAFDFHQILQLYRKYLKEKFPLPVVVSKLS